MVTADAADMRVTTVDEASMETDMAELRHLLLDCLKEDEPVELNRLVGLIPDEWQSLLALAATQRVRPLFWHRLKQKRLTDAVPYGVATTLQEVFRQNTMRNLLRYGELRTLLTKLNSEGIPLILLKGIYLADAVYDNVGLREMNDIDVLAHPADLARVAEVLSGMGYTSEQCIDPEIMLQTNHHLPPLFKAGGANFEVHWNIACPDEIGHVDSDWLWEHAVPVQVAGCVALSLAPEFLLLHLCVHTSYNHQFAFGLRPSCDIAALVNRFGATFEWVTLVDQAIRNGWQRGVYLALRLANELVDARVPADVLEKLCPADMTEDVFTTITSQVFSDKADAASIPLALAGLLESTSLFEKFRIILKRIFLPKVNISAHYSVPVDSIAIWLCYVRRVIDLPRNHGYSFKRFSQDNRLIDIAQRKVIISTWLALPAHCAQKADTRR